MMFLFDTSGRSRKMLMLAACSDPFADSNRIQEAANPFEDPQPPALAQPPAPEPAYHTFEKVQKWSVVAIIGVAGLFSGLSSNIYFPSLDAIAKVGVLGPRPPQLVYSQRLQDLNVTLGAVSLTITSYLIIQGISPVFWGSLSDTLGRRPIYIASFVVYIVANIALSFSPNFTILLIFRGIQAAGSASTVSIGKYNMSNQTSASPQAQARYR